MKVYRIESRDGFLVVGASFLAAAAAVPILGVLWSLGVIDLTAEGETTTPSEAFFGAVIAAAICAVLGYVGWRNLFRLPYEIRLNFDGSVEFVRALGRTRVAAREIRAIERMLARVETVGEDTRELRVRHAGGAIRVPFFPRADEFIADVRAMNPRVVVEGRWAKATE